MGGQSMRPLGLIGGISWRSTAKYYARINSAVNEHFGNNTNPPLFLANVDQAQVHRNQLAGDWDAVADLFADAARRLEATGVASLMFCASTPHKVYDAVARQVEVPFLHIGDAIGQALLGESVSTAGFIGTRFSMEGEFVTQRIRLSCKRVLVPHDPAVSAELQRIVREELSVGRRVDSSVEFITRVVEDLAARGAEGVVLGCTEFPALLEETDLSVRTFDALEIHANAAVEFVLSG
ncbi:MAG: amino acid racemase [Planctomycetota bacterium]